MQDSVLAIHWHPEFIPVSLIRQRISAAFPNRTDELIIPTQHNILESYGDFTGVEVDCRAPEFNRKIQFLFHFATAKLGEASVFRGMLQHTFRYRNSQLYEYIDTILDPKFEERLEKAVDITGVDDSLVEFVRIHTRKLKLLIEMNISATPDEAMRNKLVRDFFNALRSQFEGQLIDRAQVFLKAVKEVVKADFSLDYFFDGRSMIEEVRSLGGGIIIPHPEQFWPILLADYDVDGYEVWNPQSREFTEFLIDVVQRINRGRSSSDRELLVTMGDDCHMSEKIKPPDMVDPEKIAREIGLQPPWDDLSIRKRLVVSGINRQTVIQRYRERLLG